MDDPCNIQFTSVSPNQSLLICNPEKLLMLYFWYVTNLSRSSQTYATIPPPKGTTGNPKGALMTHHNLVNNGRDFGYRIGYHKKGISHL